jgi:hypothetical protein
MSTSLILKEYLVIQTINMLARREDLLSRLEHERMTPLEIFLPSSGVEKQGTHIKLRRG